MKMINRTNKSHNPQNQSNCFKKLKLWRCRWSSKIRQAKKVVLI